MSKATQRPWHKINDIPTIYAQETNKLIVICSSTYVQENEAKANAELIVRAVNTHEELIQRLEDILKYHSTTFSSQLRTDIRNEIKRAKGEV